MDDKLSSCARRSHRCSTRGGFEPKTILTWAKDKMGTGDWLRGQTEHVVMAVRGKPIVTLTNQTHAAARAPVRGHSQKPVEFYDLVESLCPAPRYADLFSRYRHNDKWDCHGDEAPSDDVGDGLDIPGFLLVENRKPPTPELRTNADDEAPPADPGNAGTRHGLSPVRKGWSRERHRRFRQSKRGHGSRSAAP